MATVIVGADKFMRQIRTAGAAILPHIGPTVRRHANATLNRAQATVPRDDGALGASAFADGPDVNRQALSVTATAGYEAAHAPFVHEGFHYGRKVSTPSKWLERAAHGGVEKALADDIGEAIMDALAQHFR